MSPERADQALLASMNHLVGELGMLTGLSVSYGTAQDAISLHTGFAREKTKIGDGILPSPLPVTQDTVYDLASLTKLFTLVCVLQLVHSGNLRLSDSIAYLDPRFLHLGACTIADCLCYLANLQTEKRLDQCTDPEQAESLLFETRQAPLPKGRLYSDMNALVLGYVVEAVSGLDLYTYIKRYILQPLGMHNTWVKVPGERQGDLMDYNCEHRHINGAWQIFDGVRPGLPHDPKARLLGRDGQRLLGHAGLFSTAGDMCMFAQGLLSGRLLPLEILQQIGINRTGWNHPGEYRQYLGQLCFAKSPVKKLSEVPSFMGETAFALSGYTGNHIAFDPDLGVFDLFLGNRCHFRLSQVKPETAETALGLSQNGAGTVKSPGGYTINSSVRYVHQKDDMLHSPVFGCLTARGWCDMVLENPI